MSDSREWYGVYIRCWNYEVACCRMKNRQDNLRIAWREMVFILIEFGYPIPKNRIEFEVIANGKLRYFNPNTL